MRLLLLVVSAILIGLLPRATFARGERSYRLPEIRETVPMPSFPITRPSWKHAMTDPSQSGDGALLALGDGIVSFASGGRICGYDATTGKQTWCATRGVGPEYANGEIAYVDWDGTVRAVAVASGHPRWHFRFATSAEGAALEGSASPIVQRVWSTGSDFLIARVDGRAGRGAPNYGEVSTTGKLLWSTELVGFLPSPYLLNGFALQSTIGSGATMDSVQRLVRLGDHGGVAAARWDEAWGVLDVRLPQVVFRGEWALGEVQEHVLTIDVEKADIRNANALVRFHFEPDYDANDALYEAGLLQSGEESYRIKLRADQEFIYPVIGKRLYRYRLAHPKNQRPLLVDDGGIFIGGPYRGALYVARVGGVWALRPGDKAIRSQLVAQTPTPLSTFAIVGRTAYMAFVDGHLRGVDVDTGRTTLDARTCRADRIAVGPHRVYAVCATSKPARIVAFDRPDR